MIDAGNVVLPNGLSIPDYAAILENYIDEIRANKSIAFMHWSSNTDYFADVTENNPVVYDPLPSRTTSSGNGLISISDDGIVLSPRGCYLYISTKTFSQYKHDVVIREGLRDVSDDTNIALLRTTLSVARTDDGSIYSVNEYDKVSSWCRGITTGTKTLTMKPYIGFNSANYEGGGNLEIMHSDYTLIGFPSWAQ